MADPDFASFVHLRGAALLRLAILLTGSTADGEDLLQDALERLYPRWDSVAEQQPEAYVRKIMVNRTISLARSPWTLRRVWQNVRQDPTVEDETASVDNRNLILEAVAALPPKMRTVIALRYLVGYSEAETSELLGVSIGTVKSQASRGIARLKVSFLAAPEPHQSNHAPERKNRWSNAR